MQVLEFKDWAGGLTEHDSPEPPNRYKLAENLLIDHDKRLYQRGGFEQYTANYLGTHERTAKLVNFGNDSELLALQNKKAFAVSAGSWTEVTGPTGHHAFPNNTAASLIADTQWNHHLFLASDNGLDPVVKMYRDGSNVMQLRTAGLPTFTETMTPTDSGLAQAIALANDLRTQMIAHYGANAATGGTPNNLVNGHHKAHADLAAQAAAVTASTPATDLPSLLALLNTLRTEYSLHIADAQKEDPGRAGSGFTYPTFRHYHVGPNGGVYTPLYVYYDNATTYNQTGFQWRHFLNFSAADQTFTLPSTTTLETVLTYLNDLRDKWNWHTYAINTHYNAMRWKGSNNSRYGTHATALARVAPYTWAQITPNYGPFIQYVKDLYQEYLRHISHDSHIVYDGTLVIDPAFDTNPTDFWGAVAMLGATANAFCFHALETDPTFATTVSYQLQGTTTSGSASLTLATGGYTADKYKYLNLLPMSGSAPGSYTWSQYPLSGGTPVFSFQSDYQVTASNTATPCVITLASSITTGQSGVQYIFSSLKQHFGQHSLAEQYFDPRAWVLAWDALDFTLGSAAALTQFGSLAGELAAAMKTHETDRQAKVVASGGCTNLKFNGQAFDIWANTGGQTANADGTTQFTHYYPDITNYPLSNIFPVGAMFGDTWAQDRFDSTPEGASYNYKIVFKNSYYVGSNYFEDRSEPSVAINVLQYKNEQYSGPTEAGKYYTSLANIQAYTNAANESYDTANMVKEIYRTIANGTSYFKLDVNGSGGEIANATTTFQDYAVDTYLVDQLQLYTNGGLPANSTPPIASCVHVCGSRTFYVKGNKVFQSLPEDPDSVPVDYFVQFDEDIIGVSSCRSIVLAFSATKVYRLLGGFDSSGRGGFDYEIIFDRTGTISMNSLVKGDNGVFFAGKDGIYFTDGIQCVRLSDLPDTFGEYTTTAAKKKLVAGAYDPRTKRLYYTLHDNGSGAPDTIWVMHLNWGLIPDATPITTFVGGFDGYTGFNPTAITVFQDALHYGDADGYIFHEDSSSYMDWEKSAGALTANRRTLLWRWKSGYLDATTGDVRKYWERITAEFKQITNLSVQIISDCDYGRIMDNLPIIRSRKLLDWGDPKIDWTSSVYTAKDGSVIDEFRRFKANGSLRSNFRAIQMQNAYCVVVKSGDMGSLTITGGNTATLTSLVATRKWPAYSVGYAIKINGVLYPVTARVSDSVVTVSGGPANGVVTDWELWGYPKNECVRFLQFFVDFDMLGQQQKDYQGATSSDGGQNSG